ncbi:MULTISPECIES: flagellar biosynthesis anti-sigma factor FlgM [Clostridium]|uniref:flagellar biosynthesis anti-sigma factor FlgM n=1 Tax=Clostridium TaxID=1485 RepID=UPI0008263752|nr:MULTISPECIES: flagellar biosynthesis anti-sigma factor FlgM [Clostridium]PJI09819.1 flagellar biosynthesis anti-sigma factor FlgM [Clostridium sp. CT7]
MKINSVDAGKVIQFYKTSKNSNINQKKSVNEDKIQISNTGRSLSAFVMDVPEEQNERKVASIQNEVSNGTYNIDPKLISQKMIDVMRNRTL